MSRTGKFPFLAVCTVLLFSVTLALSPVMAQEGGGVAAPGASEAYDFSNGDAAQGSGGQAEMSPAGEQPSGEAPARRQAPPEQSPFGLPLMMLLMLGVFWLLIFRPQAKQQKERKQMLEGIGTGDEVQLSGGILGTVRKVKDDVLVVQIADGVDVRVRRDGVAVVRPKGDSAPKEKPKEESKEKKEAKGKNGK